MDNQCYRIDTLHFKECLFENIEATYILIMENSRYENDVKKQLQQYKPTCNVHIQYNKGFKKCEKYYCGNKKKITKTYQDLAHAYINAFKDAKKNGYKQVLILEEDFIFSSDFNNSAHIKTINRFLPSMTRNKYMLSLGCAPIMTIKHTPEIRKCILSLGTHAIIYPDTLYTEIIQDCNSIEDIDVYLNTKKKYMLHKPLVYQIYNETENRANWGEQFGYIVRLINTFFSSMILAFLELDTKEEPGTSTLYKCNVYLYDFILPLIFIILMLHIINTMYS